MSHCRLLFLSLLMAVGGLVLTAPASIAADPKDSSGAEQFSGKVLIVEYSHGDKPGSAVVEKVSVKRLGERVYLVGIGIDEWSADRWAHGVTVWLPLEKVGTIYVVSNVEEVKKVFGKIRP
jgi:hypothetical protein